MKTLSNSILIALLLLAQGSWAQWGNRVSGNGNITTTTVSTGNYDEIKVVGSMDVHLEKGTEGNISITTDENLHEYVDISANNGELVIKIQKNANIRTKKGIHVTVPFQDLSEIKLVGSGDIDTKDVISANQLEVGVVGSGDIVLNVATQNLEAKVTGSGDLVISGDTQNLEVSVTGSGDFRGFDLTSQNTEVNVSGSGDAKVVAKSSIKARVNGSGDIEYRGNPAKSDTKTSGSGDITSSN